MDDNFTIIALAAENAILKEKIEQLQGKWQETEESSHVQADDVDAWE
jgi:hypothetical protein